MPTTSAPSKPSSEGDALKATDDHAPKARAIRPYFLGLGLVSALNVGCIAFIAYHLSTEHHETVYAQAIDTRPEPVDVVPTSSQLLSIVPSVSQANAEEEMEKSKEIESNLDVDPGMPFQTVLEAAQAEKEQVAKLSRPSDTEMATTSQDEEQHWVQLGALSKVATARSYWDKLKLNHPDLLGRHQHKIVGPEEADSKLHHLRVGPLDASAAESLCLALQKAGTDCFCIKEDGAPMKHGTPKPYKA